jgi:hypothetical protein
MGATKRLIEEQYGKGVVARSIAIEAKVLLECEIHGEVYDPGADPTAAYKLGNYKFTNHLLDDAFATREEMTDHIKTAIEEAPVSCPSCQSNAASE